MIIDIIICLILLASIISGIIKGLVKEIAVIAGLILGITIASQKYPALQKYLFPAHLDSPTYKVISFVIIFVVVLIIIILLGLLLKKVIQLVMLGWLDKILGGIFGFVKGLIVIWLLLMFIITVLPNTLPIINKSKLAMSVLQLGSSYTKIPLQIKSGKKDLTNTIKNNINTYNKIALMRAKKERSYYEKTHNSTCCVGSNFYYRLPSTTGNQNPT